MYFALALLALLVWAPREAQARGKRAVPDLRRDAGRWSAPGKRSMLELPVTIHLATDDGTSVAGPRRVASWVRRANAALEAYGIRVYVRAVRTLPAGYDTVTKWRERRELAGYAPSDGTIHVFVIDELDRPTRRRGRKRVRGLHWRYRGLSKKLRSREYVVVTRGAPRTTFAHELGHLFGLRHSTSEDNIMCSCRRGKNVRFTASQGRAMRSGARSFTARQAPSRGRRVAYRRR